MTYSTRAPTDQKDLGTLTPQERQLLEAFRRMAEPQKSDFQRIAQAFAPSTL